MLARAGSCTTAAPRTTEGSIQRALDAFMDGHNSRIVDEALGGRRQTASRGEFDPVNACYDLTGSRRVTTFEGAFAACLRGHQRRHPSRGWDLGQLDLQTLRECVGGELRRLRLPDHVHQAQAAWSWAAEIERLTAAEETMDEEGDVLPPEDEDEVTPIPGGEPVRALPPPPVVALVPVAKAPPAVREVVDATVEWEAEGNALRAAHAAVVAQSAARNVADSVEAERAVGAKPTPGMTKAQKGEMYGALMDKLDALATSGAITVKERNARRAIVRSAESAAYLVRCSCGVVRPNRGPNSLHCPRCGLRLEAAQMAHWQESAEESARYRQFFASLAADLCRVDGETKVAPKKRAATRDPKVRLRTKPDGAAEVFFDFGVTGDDDEDEDDEEPPKATPPKPKAPTPRGGHLKLVR